MSDLVALQGVSFGLIVAIGLILTLLMTGFYSARYVKSFERHRKLWESSRPALVVCLAIYSVALIAISLRITYLGG